MPKKLLSAIYSAVLEGERSGTARGKKNRTEKSTTLSPEVTTIFVTRAYIRRLNRQFRGKDKATDVLSFPLSESTRDCSGEIYICVPIAMKQAADYHAPVRIELARLFLHALLHLYGYDHETSADARKMQQRERLYWRTVFGEREDFPE